MFAKKYLLQALLILIALLSLLYSLIYFKVYKPLDNRYSSFKTIPILDRAKISPGYTLITPYNRFTQIGPDWQGKIYLLDLLGNPVHTWTTKHQALYAKFEPDGKLIVLLEKPSYIQGIPGGGNTGIIEELDWNSNITWEYSNDLLHHDVTLLENGNIVAPIWEKTPPEIAQKIQGGVAGTEMGGTIYSDAIVEINRKGDIVWTWHSYDHLDPNIDLLGPLMPRNAWTYTNGIQYLEKNPIDGTEGYLISMRQTSYIMIIRKSDGQIIWRSPKDMLNTQHDPTLLKNGNILVYDNGLDRVPNPFPIYGSRVVEIDPKLNKIVWQFDGGESAVDKVSIFSPIVGGAQRLDNGNTLITDGPKGHIFEVTPEKQVVWDLINPYQTKMTGKFPNNFVFKSRRYAQNEINWPETLPSPLNEFNLSIYKTLSKIYPK